jgi:hypothetical protein
VVNIIVSISFTETVVFLAVFELWLLAVKSPVQHKGRAGESLMIPPILHFHLPLPLRIVTNPTTQNITTLVFGWDITSNPIIS